MSTSIGLWQFYWGFKKVIFTRPIPIIQLLQFLFHYLICNIHPPITNKSWALALCCGWFLLTLTLIYALKFELWSYPKSVHMFIPFTPLCVLLFPFSVWPLCPEGLKLGSINVWYVNGWRESCFNVTSQVRWSLFLSSFTSSQAYTLS